MDAYLERDVQAAIASALASERKTLMEVLGTFAEAAGKAVREQIASAEGGTLELLSDLEARIARLETERRK